MRHDINPEQEPWMRTYTNPKDITCAKLLTSYGARYDRARVTEVTEGGMTHLTVAFASQDWGEAFQKCLDEVKRVVFF